MTISQWLTAARTSLLNGPQPDSANLDAELILSQILAVDRTYLISHDDQPLAVDQSQTANSWLKRRLAGEPMAYIFGFKEFYGRDFQVSPEVLIPRPESEQLIDFALKTITQPHPKIIDVGCGSGCLGISLALEMAELQPTVILSDISAAALAIAKQNLANFKLKLQTVESDLLTNFIDQKFDLIIANLPYVDHNWSFVDGVTYEPESAIFAANQGLALIDQLITQIAKYRLLTKNGWLILEADPSQAQSIRQLLETASFNSIHQQAYLTAGKLSKN